MIQNEPAYIFKIHCSIVCEALDRDDYVVINMITHNNARLLKQKAEPILESLEFIDELRVSVHKKLLVRISDEYGGADKEQKFRVPRQVGETIRRKFYIPKQ